MARGIIIAMENDGRDLNDGSDVNEAEVLSSVGESTEETHALVSDGEMVDNAATDAGTVSDIRDQLQESVDSGDGLDETAAEIAEVAIEALATSLGYKHRGRLLPAKESFGGRSSRIQATRVAIEKADNIFKRAWEAIVSTIKKIFSKIVEWFRKLFDNSAKLKKAIEEMNVDYGDKSVKTAFDSTVARGFKLGNGGTPKLTHADLVTFIANRKENIGTDLETMVSKLKEGVKSLKDYAKDFKKESSKFEVSEFVESFIKDMSGAFNFLDTKDGVLPLYGDKSVRIHIAKAASGDAASKNAENFVMIETISKGFKDNGPVVVEAWNSNQGKDLKAKALELADALVAYTKNTREVETLQKEMLTLVDEIVSMLDDATGKDPEGKKAKSSEDLKKASESFRKAIVSMTNAVSRILAPVANSAERTLAAVLTINNENAKCWAKE